ncbi:MAG: hypothetical protein PHS54_05325 [Clostridia bacterium]|nr:hypothetical protein [Clostridia bacterium]
MIKFGTSGFREIIGENFNEENITRIVFALTEIIKKDKIKNPKVVVGFDNRKMSKETAMLVADILSSKKIEVLFYSNSVISPLISYMTRTNDLGEKQYGIMITASHNPAQYNGIKMFIDSGMDSDDKFCKRIEEVANSIDYDKIKNLKDKSDKNLVKEITDISYFCKKVISFVDKENIKNKNMKVLFNAMHGSSVNFISKITSELEMTNIKIMNTNLDTNFGGMLPAPYKCNLVEQQKLVKANNYDLGIAFDGDGDRISIIDKDGKYYDCNFIFPVIYEFLLKKGYKGDVAKNYALSNLIKLIAEDYGYKCHETKVGFKHIENLLKNTDTFIGGETNGIAFKNHIYSKDGIVIAFLLIDLLSSQQKTFGQILSELQKKYNFKTEVVEYAYPITDEKKKQITKLLFEDKKLPESKIEVKDVSYIDGLKINYKNNYWGVLRFSGNENVIRLFAEMPTLKKANKQIAIYEKFIGVKVRQ